MLDLTYFQNPIFIQHSMVTIVILVLIALIIIETNRISAALKSMGPSNILVIESNFNSTSSEVFPQTLIMKSMIPSTEPTSISTFPMSLVPSIIKTFTPSYINSHSSSENKIISHQSTFAQYNEISSINCPYDFKVYVYDIPSDLSSVKLAEDARISQTLHICKKCILEQFSLEYILFDFFTQFCGRTFNPLEADYFYLPIIRDADYRVAMQPGGRGRAPSPTEVALLNILEKKDSTAWKDTFNITDNFWLEKGGSDHIIVMPAPVTNLRHESSQRGFFHYMSHLHTPIFLALEYSKSFIEEYPVCSTKKNIVLPYPTTDPDLFNGKYFSNEVDRNALIYYTGGMHGDCVEVRKALQNLWHNSSKLTGIIPKKIHASHGDREFGFRAAQFCPIPIGDSPSSKRMYDVIHFGCIPVVLSDDLIWALSDQTQGPVNHSSFSIQLPQSVVQFPIELLLKKFKTKKETFGVLPISGKYLFDLLEESYQNSPLYENNIYINPLIHILRKIPVEDIIYLQENLITASNLYRFYQMNSSMNIIPTSAHIYPDGGAIDALSKELSKRKHLGIENIRDACLQERSRKDHKYIGKYPCEKKIDFSRRLEEVSDAWCIE